MIARFAGIENRPRLIEALRQQKIIESDAVASELAEKLELVRCNPGEDLIKQDAPDSEIFFILSGRVTVLVNGREVAVRKSGQHVGEMAMIDPSARRCATVRALEETV